MTNRFISTVAIAVVMSIIPKGSTGPVTTGWDSTELQTQIGDKNSNKKKPVPAPVTGWDSTELQTQIGDTNSNKRKLVMRVWYTSLQQSNGSYDWYVRYYLKAENHNQLGSGWHQVNDLWSFTFNAVIELPSGVATLIESKNLVGLSSPWEGHLGPYNTAVLPVFKSKTAKGERSGGPHGLSITWPP